MEGIKVELTEFECKIADNLARARVKTADDKYEDPAKNYAGDDMSQTHTLGAYAELAVCKHFNIYPEISGGQEHTKYDVMLNGKRIDVKGATRHTDRLICEMNAGIRHPAEFYILAIIEGSTVWIKGGARGKDLLQEDRVICLRPNKPCFTMQQDDPLFHKLSTKCVD